MKRNVFFELIFVTAAAALLGYLYRLKPFFCLVLFGAEAAALPAWKKSRRRQAGQQKRFEEANLYIEQVLYSFRKSSKILAALTDVEKLFLTGTMAECIREAVVAIRNVNNGENFMERSLELIETEYPARRILYAHRLMVKTERIGGSCEASIRILLKDRNVWEKETVLYQKRCQMQRRNITAAILLSCLLCLLTPVLCQGALQGIRVTDSMIYQISTVLMLSAGMAIYLYTEKYFTRDWLQDAKETETMRSLQRYEKIVGYNFEAERKKSLRWSAAAGMTAVLLAFGDCWIFAGICMFAAFLLLFQHRFDYALAKRSVVHELRKVFPEWLMEVSLLLQTENVANSIRKSVEHAPELLKPELRELAEKLEDSPESNLPYSEFLREFSIPEVSSAMGMLYSLSDGGGADADVQIEEILSRNAEWMAEAEAAANQDRAGRMYLLFLLPALLGAMKMIVDMTLILFSFFAGVR